ncbi:tRNA preQ1(34) S-adenosylmethionine ribosyltransferase-isomerase QueA [Caldichromatium japonicum]|uniref:S-adenosylmethionine:tRNA ribosyltransferase-isomerase n=1 Tax=Caldichromatium japonicum TaxID=2699430 RepID=A0A6G7VG35_9GAMM|nr:tRNA preQ1(34) S-adenosylmethionine ribosyltransferase-isomerase QueA [Caldichromatium japonicum]QIK38808.1 tRNA preQ1(34) S-adenosylmethionine ribosyltransferase-isomerase QueA [Caldichromatium japonicum]
MHRSDFWYELPPELIAQHPLPERSASRLLVLEAEHPIPQDRMFVDLPSLLRSEDLLVFNNTRVMRARLFGNKETGGRVEILIERLIQPHEALAHLRASKSPKLGSRIYIVDDLWIEVCDRWEDLFRVRSQQVSFGMLMERYGHVPLPPYIQRPDTAMDEERYQTIFARHLGAVAAPTAALHFDTPLIARLDALGIRRAEITLHVGAGTFQPMREEDLDQHRMHAEWIEVNETVCAQIARTRRLGGRVIAVGTTSVRALETAASTGEPKPFCGETRLFIRPGYRFKVVDAMITNLHLPESTLLILVAAFAGYSEIMAAYRHAVAQGYRFFSYGDAMFLTHARDA